MLNWRRGGAFGDRAELPPPDTFIIVAECDIDYGYPRFATRWINPPGVRNPKWWRESWYWCLEEEMVDTLPGEKP